MKTTLSALHHQATDWLRELDFYKTEINLLLARLADAEAKNTNAELKEQFEDFKKGFNSILAEIEERKNDVSVREAAVEEVTKNNLGQDEEVSLADDVILTQVKELMHEIADSRFLFNFFLAKKA